MKFQLHAPSPVRSPIAWSTVLLAGIAAPVLAMLLLVEATTPVPLSLVRGPILAIGLMGTGMIAAAAAGRLWVGVLLALLTGCALTLLASELGLPPFSHPVLAGVAAVIASVSFAARGALFARSASDKGWLVAVLIVAGEAALVATAVIQPEFLPNWLLALLPAQWASVAIDTAIIGTSGHAAIPALIALVGTALATLVVVWLWPRRWTYLIMFSSWLGLSALVYNS